MPPCNPSVSQQPYDFPEQLRAARAGNRDLLGRLFKSCHDCLREAARASVQGDHVAENSVDDLLQETYLQATRDLVSFRGNCTREWLGWLRGILRHRVTDLHRAQPKNTQPLTPANEPDRKSTRLNSSHIQKSRMPSSA